MRETGAEDLSILRSEDLARSLANKWLAPVGGEALEGVLRKSDQ
jgi:hypothetical protein